MRNAAWLFQTHLQDAIRTGLVKEVLMANVTKEQAVDAIKMYIGCMSSEDAICDKFSRCTECPFGGSLPVTSVAFMTDLVKLLEEK